MIHSIWKVARQTEVQVKSYFLQESSDDDVAGCG